ncbi:MAG: zinc ribbon domain-containing protein [Acidobacteria bacterium]|nr:zinc ribbon domain-containing protein [Acidobacteriota bacterium]
MPLYEYECKSCHRRVEKRQKFSDPPLTECPHCGGAMEKCLTAPAVQFKGGGWYADGYGNKKSGSSTESKSSTSSDKPSSESASSSSSDSAKTTTPAASSATPASTASSSSDKK